MTLSILGFSLAVGIFWWRSHFFVGGEPWLFLSTPLLAWSVVTFCVLAVVRQTQPFVVRRFVFLPLLLAATLFVFNAQVWLPGWWPGHEAILPPSEWLSSNIIVFLKLLTVSFVWLVLTAVFLTLGETLFKVFGWSTLAPDTPFSMLARLVVGMSGWAIIILFLGLADWLHPLVLLALGFFSLAFEWSFLRRGATWLTDRVVVSWRERDLSLILLMFIVFLLAINLAQSLRPHPTGYDDMTAYMNRVKLISDRAALVPGSLPFPFELLASALRLVTHEETLWLAMSFGTYAYFLGGVVVASLAAWLWNQRAGLTAAALTLSLPMTQALALREVKPDALLFPTVGVMLFALLLFLERRDQRFLFLASLVFGWAVSIKLTTLFMLAPFLFVLGWWIRDAWTTERRVKTATLVATSLFFFLPLIPWASWAWMTQRDASRVTERVEFKDWQGMLATHAPDDTLSNRVQLLIRPLHCPMSGVAEDYSRYETDRTGWTKYLSLPWDMTMNRVPRLFATEVGFLFLALLPFWLFRRSPSAAKQAPPLGTRYSAFFWWSALGLFVLFLFLGHGILWYAAPGFLILALLVAGLDSRLASQSLLRTFFWIMLFVGLVGSTVYRLKLAYEPVLFQQAAGLVGEAEFLERFNPGFQPISAIVNRDRETGVWVIGSRLFYGVRDNDRRTILDPSLDIFDCLLRRQGAPPLINTFHNLGVRHIIVSRDQLSQSQNTQTPTLTAKVHRFSDFADTSLAVVWTSSYTILYAVPDPP